MLKILLNKDSYNRYKEHIDFKYLEDNHRELSFLYKTLKTLHEKVETSISVDELSAFFSSLYPQADKTIYEGLFSSLGALQISEEGGDAILTSMMHRQRSMQLSELAFKVAQGQKTQEDLDAFLDTLDTKEEHSSLPIEPLSLDLEDLVGKVYSEQGFRWRLDALNKSLGSLRPGDFGFIFARPETGKTTFLASEASYMLEKDAGCVVWFNNEEQDEKVVLRVYQAHFGITFDKLLSNLKGYSQEFNRKFKGKFFFFSAQTLQKNQYEKVIKKINPALVIYDQIDKIKGFAADRDDLKLGAIYQWARELAKGSHASIGVCQADGTAEGVRYLTMDHVANAKTSKQAEGDFIIGIGKTHQDGHESMRYLNICKNKLFGDKDSLADLRHGRFEVLIKPEIARFEDLVTFS